MCIVVSVLKKMANCERFGGFCAVTVTTCQTCYKGDKGGKLISTHQPQADSHPEIRIAGLPNRTPEKLKGWSFISWHSIEDLFKIKALTAELFSRNAAFQATSIHGWDFVSQRATVTLFAPHWLNDAKLLFTQVARVQMSSDESWLYKLLRCM